MTAGGSSISVACEEWAASLGAAGLIRKPFENETLLAELRHCDGSAPLARKRIQRRANGRPHRRRRDA